MKEIYGYVRVSDKYQHEDRQVQAILAYYPQMKEDNLFIEKISGKSEMDSRPEYAVLRRLLRPGDELVVDALDRLGRKKTDVKKELEYIKGKGVLLRILSIPTTLQEVEGQSWVMEMINNVIVEVYTSLLEQELNEKERRQAAGIAVAKARGVYKGRMPIEYNESQFVELYQRWKTGAIKSKEFMALMQLRPNTFYRIVKKYESNKMMR
ncbi:recombinase family protein [Faecalispora jeddahensis]|uniref:recombinase family protein n=1 Tax=Faecalispora jeddahensis TaxID=1414721 RepID=UPI00145C0CFC|nr:recombinase family protein [Faecalispora jeddahensis]